MSSPEPQDPFVEAEIERAVAPYRALLSPAALEEMRDTLRDALTRHPVAVELVRRSRPVSVVGKSGERPIDGALPAGGGGAKRGGGAR